MPEPFRRSPEAMDPSDRLDYAFDVADLLEPGETLASSNWSLPSNAASEGLQIYTQERIGSRAIVWLDVSASQRANERWNGEGRTYPISCTMTTSSTPPRIRERSLGITVRNR